MIGNTVTPASGLAYQLGGGVQFALSDNVSLDLGYRYKVLTGASFDLGPTPFAITDRSISSHNFNLGLTYRF